VLGALLLTCGYVLLAVPDRPGLLFPALALVAVGGGIFKANPANLISRLYEGDSAQIDSAFTMYYMAVNVGATASQIATPLIAIAFGWHVAFAVCAAGLVVGLLNYFFMRRFLAHVGSKPDSEPLRVGMLALILVAIAIAVVCVSFILQSRDLARAVVLLAFVVLVVIFGVMMKRGSDRERKGLWAVIILIAEGMLFFIFYQQMSTSLNLFAQRNVDLDFRIFGLHLFTWIPEQYQNLNAVWIVLLSPVLVLIYNSLGRLGKDPSIAAKFVWGFSAVAIGFFIYGVGARWAVNGQVSSWIMVWGYGLYSLGELLVSGLGLAMIARYVPERMGGFMMGAYFVASGLSQYLGSVVANFAHIPENLTNPIESLSIYTRLFNELGYGGVFCTVIAIAMLPLMKKLSRSHSDTALAGAPLPAVRSEEFNLTP
jgi:proton-dependent oligopeptide transporter, POT family